MKPKEIDDLVKSRLTDTANDIYPVLDGIVNENEYNKNKYKILWILKEAHGKGIRDLRCFLGDKSELMHYKYWKRTFNPIIYITYSIHNNFMAYGDMYDTHKKPEMVDILKKTAFINLKKISGNRRSYYKTIRDAYRLNSDIILTQIESYNPNIIICGGTIGYIRNDMKLGEPKAIDQTLQYYLKEDKIFIDAYHPNFRGDHEKYCNNIINVVSEWASSLKK